MAAKKKASKKAPVEPKVDPTLDGKACRWEGVEGTIKSIVSYDPKSGLPDRVVFRPRQNPLSHVDVAYEDITILEGGF